MGVAGALLSACAALTLAGLSTVARPAAAAPPGGGADSAASARPSGSVSPRAARPRARRAAGTVVRGMLYIDDFVDSQQFLSGSQLAALPYSYTVSSRLPAVPGRQGTLATRAPRQPCAPRQPVHPAACEPGSL